LFQSIYATSPFIASTKDLTQAPLAENMALFGIFLLIGSAGVFFLPLFDPVVRHQGPAPTLWKVMMVAVIFILFLLSLYTLRFGSAIYPFLDLDVLLAAGLVMMVLVGAGLILTLSGIPAWGAWTGGLGSMIGLIALLVWVLTGGVEFP
jgi:hypothetical protein